MWEELSRREEMGPWSQQEEGSGYGTGARDGQISHVISSVLYVKQEARPSAETGAGLRRV